MSRIDLATPIHKCVRKILFDQAMSLARTDFTNTSEIGRAVAELRDSLALLHEHGEHEDQLILPLLRDADPALFAECVAQHGRLARGFRELELLGQTVALVTESERAHAGARLTQRFYDFVREQLEHLTFEESRMLQALWRACSDEQLLQARQRILARVPAERAPTWRGLMLAAANASELSALPGA